MHVVCVQVPFLSTECCAAAVVPSGFFPASGGLSLSFIVALSCAMHSLLHLLVTGSSSIHSGRASFASRWSKTSTEGLSRFYRQDGRG
ncbi:hypothetical protein V8F20_012141 [Naviculisporaceae sp. PSN 640]